MRQDARQGIIPSALRMSAHCISLAGDSLLELERRVEGFEEIAELD